MRPLIWLAALMGAPGVIIFTHDSIGVGGDGPTHQPIEQLMSLRAIPHTTVDRPADAHEMCQAWRAALLNTLRPHGPYLHAPELVRPIGYVVSPATGVPQGRVRSWWESAHGGSGCDPHRHGIGG